LIAARGRALLLALLVGLLTACTVAPLRATSEVGPDQGVVVIRVVVNAAPTGLETGYGALHVSGDTGLYELHRSTVGVVRTAVFTGALPPGRYRLSHFENVGQTVIQRLFVPAALGPFTIKAGQLADLGTLVYQPVGGYVPFGSGKVLLAHTRVEAETRELVQAEFPRVSEAVLAQPMLGWDANPGDADNARVFAHIRGRVVPINDPRLAASGAIYAGSALGQVLVRPAGQPRWQQLDTGTTREILSVAESGGSLVAAGEEGFLVRSTDGGRAWQRLPAPNRGALVHVAAAPDGGLIVVSLLGGEFNVWQSKADGWQSLNRFPFERSYNATLTPAHATSTAARLYVAMPNGTIHTLDLASGRWERTEAPFSLINLQPMADGVLYAWGVRFTNSSWRSEDGGRSWQDLDMARRAGAPIFTNRNTGYVVCIKEIYGGARSVQTTRDGGQTWTETGVLPDSLARVVILNRPMFVHPAGPTLFAFGINGAVFASSDGGATWSEERGGVF